jgi:hypothetical protein
MSSNANGADGLRLLSMGKWYSYSIFLIIDLLDPLYRHPANQSLDAGTLAGALSQLLLIQEIMRRLSFEMKGKRLLPADYFDMIAGSGFGG